MPSFDLVFAASKPHIGLQSNGRLPAPLQAATLRLVHKAATREDNVVTDLVNTQWVYRRLSRVDQVETKRLEQSDRNQANG